MQCYLVPLKIFDQTCLSKVNHSRLRQLNSIDYQVNFN